MWFDVLKRKGNLKIYVPALKNELDRWIMQNDLDVFHLTDIIDYIDIDKIIKQSIEEHNKRKHNRKIGFRGGQQRKLMLKKIHRDIDTLMRKKGYERWSGKVDYKDFGRLENTWSLKGRNK